MEACLDFDPAAVIASYGSSIPRLPGVVTTFAENSLSASNNECPYGDGTRVTYSWLPRSVMISVPVIFSHCDFIRGNADTRAAWASSPALKTLGESSRMFGFKVPSS